MAADTVSKDANLQTIIHAISYSWKAPNAPDLKPFYSFRDELSTKVCPTDADKSTIICKKGSYFDSNSTSSAAFRTIA